MNIYKLEHQLGDRGLEHDTLPLFELVVEFGIFFSENLLFEFRV